MFRKMETETGETGRRTSRFGVETGLTASKTLGTAGNGSWVTSATLSPLKTQHCSGVC